jgi:acetyltransferase
MLDSLFSPRSVAIIGASSKELSIGNRIVKNLIDFGFTGKIFPINPKADSIRDIKAYPSINEVPDDIDLAHIVIPSKFVPQALEDCGKKEVRFVIINTAGFKEIGKEGLELEQKVIEVAKRYGIRVFGPNCQGIINSDSDVRAYCNFTFTKPVPGNISIVAQSGGVGEVLNQRFSELGEGVCMYASNGNACDVSIPEIIRYWGDDDKTKVIVVHIESLSDPKEFAKVAKEVTTKKPILGMKTGRTMEGAKAVSSHTGGLVKEDIAVELIFEKCGVVTFRDEEDLCQSAIAFASQPIPKGNHVGLITNTGGPAIIATDELVEAKLTIPNLSQDCIDSLRDKLYPEASLNNPIDVLATATADHFRAAMDALMRDDNIHSLYINFVTPFFVDTESIAKQIADVNSESNHKPIVVNVMTDKSHWTETLRILKEGNVPFYSFPETAARALAAMTEYARLKDRKLGEIKTFNDIDRTSVERIMTEIDSSSEGYIPSKKAYDLLASYRIPIPAWNMAKDIEEAQTFAKEIGFPVVVKAEAEGIIHKSDAGGIALDIKDEETLKEAVLKIQEKIAPKSSQLLIQKFIPEGKEVIIGAKDEPGLGHLIMFGIGGIYVEVFEDVVFKVAPITEFEGKEMINAIKGHKLLDGVRGETEADITSLVELLLRVSHLLTDFPQIKEMDLNPVITLEEGKGCYVTDVRIRI